MKSEDLKQFIDGCFAMQDTRLEVRFGATDKRFEALDERFDTMDQRFYTMDTRFDDNEMVQNEIQNAIGNTLNNHEKRIVYLVTTNARS